MFPLPIMNEFVHYWSSTPSLWVCSWSYWDFRGYRQQLCQGEIFSFFLRKRKPNISKGNKTPLKRKNTRTPSD